MRSTRFGAVDEAGCGRSSAVELLQAPSPENGLRASCQARVTTDRGTFTALADADPGNAGRSDVATLLTLAQLRAKSHALCDAFNLTLKPVEDLVDHVPSSLLDRHRHVNRGAAEIGRREPTASSSDEPKPGPTIQPICLQKAALAG